MPPRWLVLKTADEHMCANPDCRHILSKHEVVFLPKGDAPFHPGYRSCTMTGDNGKACPCERGSILWPRVWGDA